MCVRVHSVALFLRRTYTQKRTHIVVSIFFIIIQINLITNIIGDSDIITACRYVKYVMQNMQFAAAGRPYGSKCKHYIRFIYSTLQ